MTGAGGFGGDGIEKEGHFLRRRTVVLISRLRPDTSTSNTDFPACRSSTRHVKRGCRGLRIKGCPVPVQKPRHALLLHPHQDLWSVAVSPSATRLAGTLGLDWGICASDESRRIVGGGSEGWTGSSASRAHCYRVWTFPERKRITPWSNSRFGAARIGDEDRCGAGFCGLPEGPISIRKAVYVYVMGSVESRR